MGIFRISLTQGEVNKETKRGRFHEPLGVIKSETIKSKKEDLLRGRGLGEKKKHSRDPGGIPNRKKGKTMNPMASTLRYNRLRFYNAFPNPRSRRKGRGGEKTFRIEILTYELGYPKRV
jgi:hypothetical protein